VKTGQTCRPSTCPFDTPLPSSPTAGPAPRKEASYEGPRTALLLYTPPRRGDGRGAASVGIIWMGLRGVGFVRKGVELLLGKRELHPQKIGISLGLR
jgi:hypothetical protein